MRKSEPATASSRKDRQDRGGSASRSETRHRRECRRGQVRCQIDVPMDQKAASTQSQVPVPRFWQARPRRS
jgi:hypothetical protein